jgi:hypothetical protein
MVAPLNFEEFDLLAPSDTTLLIQDLDWVLGVGQVCLEQCHFRQYHIYGCLQALLQLRHVKDVVTSCQRRW